MTTIVVVRRQRVKKLIGSELVKKFPTFYGNRRFITVYYSTVYTSLVLSYLYCIRSSEVHRLALTENPMFATHNIY